MRRTTPWTCPRCRVVDRLAPDATTPCAPCGYRKREGVGLWLGVLFDGSGVERVRKIALTGFDLAKAVLADATWLRRVVWSEGVQNPCDEHAHADHNGQSKDANEENVVHVRVLRSSAVPWLRG